MRHYEIMLLIHPDQSEQVGGMVERYVKTIKDGGGALHRLEDLGRRQLAFMIDKIHKAHYVLMNIECSSEILEELENAFRFNDAVLRKLVIRRDEAVTEPSPLLKSEEDKSDDRPRSRDSGPAPDAASEDSGAGSAPEKAEPAGEQAGAEA